MRTVAQYAAVLLFLGFAAGLLAQQRNAYPYGYNQGFGNNQRGGFNYGYDSQQMPAEEKAEWIFARLRFSSMGSDSFGDYGGFRRGGGWSEDYPKAERQLSQGIRRLTRLDARSYEQVVDLDSDDFFNMPWLYAVNVGYWGFSDDQAARLREYLHRGGFLMVDSFHGDAEWVSFMRGMHQVLPDLTDKQVEELPNSDEIFHVLYDLDQKIQIPGYQYIGTGRTYESNGIVPHWRAIRDSKGRIMVAMCYNMHIGDAWEHADDPRYPERFSSLAYRMAINYIIYGMTH